MKYFVYGFALIGLFVVIVFVCFEISDLWDGFITNIRKPLLEYGNKLDERIQKLEKRKSK